MSPSRQKRLKLRLDRRVTITIMDTHRPLEVVKLVRRDLGDGRWGRWRGGKTGIGKVVATWLE